MLKKKKNRKTIELINLFDNQQHFEQVFNEIQHKVNHEFVYKTATNNHETNKPNKIPFTSNQISSIMNSLSNNLTIINTKNNQVLISSIIENLRHNFTTDKILIITSNPNLYHYYHDKYTNLNSCLLQLQNKLKQVLYQFNKIFQFFKQQQQDQEKQKQQQQQEDSNKIFLLI